MIEYTTAKDTSDKISKSSRESFLFSEKKDLLKQNVSKSKKFRVKTIGALEKDEIVNDLKDVVPTIVDSSEEDNVIEEKKNPKFKLQQSLGSFIVADIKKSENNNLFGTNIMFTDKKKKLYSYSIVQIVKKKAVRDVLKIIVAMYQENPLFKIDEKCEKY